MVLNCIVDKECLCCVKDKSRMFSVTAMIVMKESWRDFYGVWLPIIMNIGNWIILEVIIPELDKEQVLKGV